MKKFLVGTVIACTALALAGCGGDSSANGPATDAGVQGPPARPPGPMETQSGKQAAARPEPNVPAPTGPPTRKLIVKDLIKGTGKTAERDDELAVHFVSIRYNGEFFESIWDKPFEFELSRKDVNPGWVRGLPGMRAGGRRELEVPTELTSRFPIPADENYPEKALIYVVDLLRVH